MTVQIIKTSKLADQYGLIGLSALAGAVGLVKQSVRELPVEPRFPGRRTGEASYRLNSVIDHLRDLNPGKDSVWSDHFLKPLEAARWLSENGMPITANALAKRRMRHLGPPYLRVSPRTVRYREEDLLEWICSLNE